MGTWDECPCIMCQIAKLYLKTKYTVSREFYKLPNDIYAAIIRKVFLSEF